jgi:hypothetical protein
VITILPRAGGGWDSTVAGTITTPHGALTFSGDNSAARTGNPLYAITFTGADGFTSAAGGGTFNFSGSFAGNGRFIIDGNINGPSARFDTTPPNVIVKGSSARPLGGDRYSISIRYQATDAGGLTRAELLTPGVAKPLWSGPVSGTVRDTIHVKSSTRRITLRLVVTDTSANSARRTIIIKLN